MQNALFEEAPIENNSEHYLVLARKYRPSTFKDMIGQEILVKTFTNAIDSGRIPHAILLTGIRGIGKTTTARIIARALNCVGADGNGDITIDPCGKCYHCTAISDDRHQDVIEIDAASHTSVNDVREIIENARYKPISARYKIYIIDETHMLSNSAFNALLKILEEPPLHVKFILATTETRKIPLTILSRCQRFDLKRVSIEDLTAHFQNVLSQEGFKAPESSLKLIAAAAAGSIRDGLSILDQAISHTGGDITEATIREMLGLSSRDELFSLYYNLLSGEVSQALEKANHLYAFGADPMLIIQDMMDITHMVLKGKVDQNYLNSLSEADRNWCFKILEKCDVAKLNRIWVALLRGYDELKSSMNSLVSLEMLIIRMAHLSTLPPPEDVIRRLYNKKDTSAEQATQAPATQQSSQPTSPQAVQQSEPTATFTGVAQTPADLMKILFDADEMMLYHHVRSDVKIIKIENNRVALHCMEGAPKTLNTQLKEALEKATGEKWTILGSADECQSSTLAQQERAAEDKKINEVKNHPNVKEVLNTFTGLEIADIKLQNVS